MNEKTKLCKVISTYNPLGVSKDWDIDFHPSFSLNNKLVTLYQVNMIYIHFKDIATLNSLISTLELISIFF